LDNLLNLIFKKDINLFSTYHLSLFLESTVSYKNQADDSSEFAKSILVLGLVEENTVNSINTNKSTLVLDKLILNFLSFGKSDQHLLI
tara:strand:+ start:345 stop:608 length:264 start_codon:yes stop_codon:yes gene_type:complete